MEEMEKWKTLFYGLFPSELTVLGLKLTRKQYFAVSGLVLLFLILLGFSLNKRGIRKEIEAYMKIEQE